MIDRRRNDPLSWMVAAIEYEIPGEGGCEMKRETMRSNPASQPGNRRAILAIAMAGATAFATAQAQAASLQGSRASLYRQQRMAERHDYSFLRTPAEVRRFASSGYLVPVRGNSNYELAHVSFPYARQEVKLFVERLSAQYRASCGEKLVITSLTRPHSHQPRNASDLSVHPTGMAVDLRVSNSRRCRSWLEDTLLELERRQLVEATREHRPPHYHVVLNPRPYAQWVASGSSDREPENAGARTADARRYKVRPGDSLWTIARRYGTTVATIKQVNNLSSSRIKPGLELLVP